MFLTNTCSYFKKQDKLFVTLPDGTSMGGYIARKMPFVDSISQTQQVLVKVKDMGTIPENLIAQIKLIKNESYGIAVPREAVLANDTQTSFWVMKMINDSTAVKTEVIPGLQNDKFTQIKSGNILKADKVVTSGNFGMADTTLVRTVQK